MRGLLNNNHNELLVVLRSARLMLWLPIILNVAVITLLLTCQLHNAIWLSISLCCIASFGFLINDIRDRRVDAINRVGRLELATKGTLRLARNAAFGLVVVGLGCSALVGTQAFLLSLGLAVGLTAYTFYLRPKFLTANLASAILASSPIWLPNAALGRSPSVAHWVIIVAAALLLLGREIIFDTAHRVGDSVVMRRTIPIVFGDTAAIYIAAILQLAGCTLLCLYFGTMGWFVPGSTHFFGYASIAMITLCILPVNLRITHTMDIRTSIRQFTILTRIAMLFLPVVLLAAIGG